jgi:hypothetical protein
VPSLKFNTVVLPVIDRLPDDPEWEKTELAFAKHEARKLPPFEECVLLAKSDLMYAAPKDELKPRKGRAMDARQALPWPETGLRRAANVARAFRPVYRKGLALGCYLGSRPAVETSTGRRPSFKAGEPGR